MSMSHTTKVRSISDLNEKELKMKIFDWRKSWHAQYSRSAYVYVGGLPDNLTEGDVICVFSQYGKVVHIHMVRDKKTGKPRGFCFLAYEDQLSTILAVDNLNGIKIGGRLVKVDHVASFRPPGADDEPDEAEAESTTAASSSRRSWRRGDRSRDDGDDRDRDRDRTKREENEGRHREHAGTRHHRHERRSESRRERSESSH